MKCFYLSTPGHTRPAILQKTSAATFGQFYGWHHSVFWALCCQLTPYVRLVTYWRKSFRAVWPTVEAEGH